jgi:hypothetical protein
MQPRPEACVHQHGLPFLPFLRCVVVACVAQGGCPFVVARFDACVGVTAAMARLFLCVDRWPHGRCIVRALHDGVVIAHGDGEK